MPLKKIPKGAGKAKRQAVISKNIGELVGSGKYPPRQAAAIAYSAARKQLGAKTMPKPRKGRKKT